MGGYSIVCGNEVLGSQTIVTTKDSYEICGISGESIEDYKYRYQAEKAKKKGQTIKRIKDGWILKIEEGSSYFNKDVANELREKFGLTPLEFS